jgi:hypothetical protein
MRSSRFGGLLLGIGAVVGVAAVVGLVTGFEPSRLPAAMLDLAVYKLTFVAAAGLLVAGAVLRRYGLRGDRGGERTSGAGGVAAARAAPVLPAPPAEVTSARSEPRSKVDVPRDGRGDA